MTLFPATVEGVIVQANRLIIATSIPRAVDWYTPWISPPEGCYQALLYLYLVEAPVTGNELKVAMLGVNEAQGDEDWSAPSEGAHSLAEPVQPARYGNCILYSPHVTDGGPGTIRTWTRRAVVDKRIRFWFYGSNGTTYTYNATLHFIP